MRLVPEQFDGGRAWFAEMFSGCDVAQRVGEVLAEADLEEDWQRVWAACHVVYRYSKPGLWPSRSLEPTLRSCTSLLIEGLEASSVTADPELRELVHRYIRHFETRLETLSNSETK